MRGSELRKLRLELGLTQKQLAMEIGVAEHTVWRWEHDKRRISRIVALGLRAYVETRRQPR